VVAPGTPWDRFVLAYGQGAFLDARTTCASGLTSEAFFNLLARDDSGGAPGFPEAEKARHPTKAVSLHGFAARAIDSGTKTPVSADHVAEISERYFGAFSALLSASTVAGAKDREGPVYRLASLRETVLALRVACAAAIKAWKAADAAQALWALETTRTELLRVAADLHGSATLTAHIETSRRIADLVPEAQKLFEAAGKAARAKEGNKRAAPPGGEPPGKVPKATACRFGGACKRHKEFLAGTRKVECPDGTH
jgi:hypothetical protein